TAIRATIEAVDDNRITDFHVWPIGSHHFAAILSIVTHAPKPPDHYRNLLDGFPELEHVTIEINHCRNEPCHDIGSTT
ncbi:MAG: hypothetical protein Q8J76_03565, partial [Desulfobulbaceae bacterium]|nr:hypothetical protein [Desulfobulbaceae bacterium]